MGPKFSEKNQVLQIFFGEAALVTMAAGQEIGQRCLK
jgi:hypothetical protein